jgi:Dyp-type peroxidase family
MVELERKDIQGMLVSSYKYLPCSAYLLLRVTDAGAARSWISELLPEITVSEKKQENLAINVAFTYTGLHGLGLPQDGLDSFSFPFQEGMAADYRSRLLGDTDENAPAGWDWGKDGNRVDVLLLLFGKDAPALQAELERQRAAIVNRGLELVSVLTAGRQPDTHEHFGFNDGIGQPVMKGTGNKQRQLQRTHHATELPAGEFLLGYPNIYGVIAPSPAVKPEEDPLQLLTVVPSDAAGLNAQPGMRDFGRNGSYLVFRQLSQRVAAFWNFLDQATRDPNGESNVAAREHLGAKFVGRWQSGAPLVLSPDKDDPTLANENNFDYNDKDPYGMKCPIGSHVRRSNPRDSLGPDPKTALNSANRHRILRRGRSYGHRIENPLVDDGVERGLHFICLNSDIERQFEFVQQTWLNNPVFASLTDEVDPIVGNLAKGDKLFTVQGSPLRRRVENLSRFVVVKGGAYFFLPSLRALNYIARLQPQR